MAGPVRIVIVDDHPVVRDGLRGMLTGDDGLDGLGRTVTGFLLNERCVDINSTPGSPPFAPRWRAAAQPRCAPGGARADFGVSLMAAARRHGRHPLDVPTHDIGDAVGVHHREDLRR